MTTKRAYDPVRDPTPCCRYPAGIESSSRRQVAFCPRCGEVVAPYILFPRTAGLDLETGLVGVVGADRSVQGVLL